MKINAVPGYRMSPRDMFRLSQLFFEWIEQLAIKESESEDILEEVIHFPPHSCCLHSWIDVCKKEGKPLNWVRRDLLDHYIQGSRDISTTIWHGALWELATTGCESWNGVPFNLDGMGPSCWLFPESLFMDIEWRKWLEVSDWYDSILMLLMLPTLIRLNQDDELTPAYLISSVLTGSSEDDSAVKGSLTRTKIIPWDIYPEEDKCRTPISADVMAANEFMKLPLIRKEIKHGMTRAQRRRRMKKTRRQVNDRMQIIKLRKVEPIHGSDSDNGSSHRHLTCRFMVRGFWRRQWYPSLQKHRPVFIHPFMKGPKGAPFKTPRIHTIKEVVR